MRRSTEPHLPGRLSRGGPVLFPTFLFVVCLAALSSLARPVVAQTSTGHSAAPVAPKKTASSPRSKSQKKKPAASRRQTAPDPARISEIQTALAREGFYSGEPTGKWDASSIDAMKNFQQARGLQPTGKIEALSLQKLGLGSPVAGMAAPDPQPPALPQTSPAKSFTEQPPAAVRP